MSRRLQGTFDRKGLVVWAIVTAMPVIALWFIILDESTSMGLIKNPDLWIPLAIGAIACSIMWTYWTLRRLSDAGILRIRLCRATSSSP